MKTVGVILISAAFLLGLPALSAPKADEATHWVERAEENTTGESVQADVTMAVHSGSNDRTLSLKLWSVGRDKVLIKILKPEKDRDTGNLRQGLNLWQYLPNIERIVKIPPSMMLQSWMGSDFTNDDLVKASSLTRDYTHEILARETVNGSKSLKILCQPKPDAPVTWGKVILWVRDPDAAPIKQEYYNERGELLKVMDGTEIKIFGKHVIPTLLTMHNLKKDGAWTALKYEKIVFDQKIEDRIFTQEYLRKPVAK